MITHGSCKNVFPISYLVFDYVCEGWKIIADQKDIRRKHLTRIHNVLHQSNL